MDAPDDPLDIRDPAAWTWAPSLKLRTAADTERKVQELLAHLESTQQDQLILRLVANSPNAFRPFVLMADALVNRPTLPHHVREALVLWLAVQLDDAYEWHSHVEPARRAGVTEEQFADIRAGVVDGTDSRLDPGQQLAIRLVAPLRAGDGWTDEQWHQAIDAWGVEGAFDVVLSAGWWAGLVPMVLRAMRLAPSS